jgi:methylenetetrahydrofolate--tRNA-(uracil-5-)-methyltransferase
MMKTNVLIIGAGLAGSEAALFLARRGIRVFLMECKAHRPNEAQKLTTAAELVCTNSLKSKDSTSAHGILKGEMRAFSSVVLEVGERHSVPAGNSLAVDRDKFSCEIHRRLADHPLITFVEDEVSDPLLSQQKYNCEYVIVATGPLTKKNLESWIKEHISGDDLYFYDAIAPVVEASSLDFSKLYYKDRYRPLSEDEGESADYLNAPLNKEEYEQFVLELLEAKKVAPQNFEKAKFFEACLPIDTLAQRGVDTLRFSCMKPVGLEDEKGKRPYACVQLRRENLAGSAFNLVGFQNKLTYGEQKRVFRLIPGFAQASFIHLGSVHRNTFLHAKKVLNPDLSSKTYPHVFFAGQITGVEGYTESASMGLYAAFQIWRKIEGKRSLIFPIETSIGALVNYIMTASRPAPSNINFGLFPSVEVDKKKFKGKERKVAKRNLLAKRAQQVFFEFLKEKSPEFLISDDSLNRITV